MWWLYSASYALSAFLSGVMHAPPPTCSYADPAGVRGSCWIDRWLIRSLEMDRTCYHMHACSLISKAFRMVTGKQTLSISLAGACEHVRYWVCACFLWIKVLWYRPLLHTDNSMIIQKQWKKRNKDKWERTTSNLTIVNGKKQRLFYIYSACNCWL